MAAYHTPPELYRPASALTSGTGGFHACNAGALVGQLGAWASMLDCQMANRRSILPKGKVEPSTSVQAPDGQAEGERRALERGAAKGHDLRLQFKGCMIMLELFCADAGAHEQRHSGRSIGAKQARQACIRIMQVFN